VPEAAEAFRMSCAMVRSVVGIVSNNHCIVSNWTRHVRLARAAGIEPPFLPDRPLGCILSP